MRAHHSRRRRTAFWLSAATLAAIPHAVWAQTSPPPGQPAEAQSADETNPHLEEIIVTARKREEDLLRSPVAVQVVQGDDLERVGISNLEQVSAQAPTVQIGRAGQTSLIFIRGIGSGINRGFEQSAGLFVDGVYMPRSRQFTATMLDVERIEILRGPQGLLFGKNTIAGAIQIETASPSLDDRFDFNAAFTWEPDFNTTREDVTISGALAENFGLRLAALYDQSDGYVDNIPRSADEPRRISNGARLTALWEPTADLRIEGKVGYVLMRDRGENITVPVFNPSLGVGLPVIQRLGVLAAPIADPRFAPADGAGADRYTSFVDNPNYANADHERTRSIDASIRVDWDLSENLTLTSVTGRSDFLFSQQHDVDFLPINLIENHDYEEMELWSQEIRLTSSFDGPLNFFAGVYYEDQRLFGYNNPLIDGTIGGLAPLLAGAPSLFCADFGSGPVCIDDAGFLSAIDQEATTISGFVEATWEFAPMLFADLGARISREQKDVHRFTYLHLADRDTPVVDSFGGATGAAGPATTTLLSGVIASVGTTPSDVFFNQESDHLEPSVRFRWEPGDDTMIYLTYGEGYKGGGVNASGGSTFEPETTRAWELGLRTDVMSGRGRAGLTVYNAEVENLQTTSFVNTVFVVGNAARVRSRGIEADAQFAVTDALEVGAAIAYLDNEYVSYENAPCTIAQLAAAASAGQSTCTQVLSGQRGPFAPEWSGNIYARYSRPVLESLEFSFAVALNYKSEQFLDFDLDPNKFQDEYFKINARLALGTMGDGPGWEAAIFGRNLTDQATYTFGVGVPLAAGAFAHWIEEPRVIGVQMRGRF